MRWLGFDDALDALVRKLIETGHGSFLDTGVVLRDANGRLKLFVDVRLKTNGDLSERLAAALGPYGRDDALIEWVDEGSLAALGPPLWYRIANISVQVVDRRIVGSDWVRPPDVAASGPPRIVFASLKGGVGRSTALGVSATHLALQGKRVLAIDLDLEAPGLGAMLLDDDTTPSFGSLDYLVENGLGQVDNAFLADVRGPSKIAARGGRIDVVPAFGKKSLDNPGEILAKIARAYLEDVRDGNIVPLRVQIREFVDVLAKDYDVVLVDSRAGLHEAAAGPILGLGAEVLLFGLDERQTFIGYSALLAHLAHFVAPNSTRPEWFDRMNIVHAKAASSRDLQARFKERWLDLVRSYTPGANDKIVESVETPENFHNPEWTDDTVSAEEETADYYFAQSPIHILRDDNYERFEPLANTDSINPAQYQATFAELLAFLDATLGIATKS